MCTLAIWCRFVRSRNVHPCDFSAPTRGQKWSTYLKKKIHIFEIPGSWPVRRESPKTDVTICWPQNIYALYNFYGAMATIKSSLYFRIPMLKRFSAQSPVKIGTQNCGFWKFKDLNITRDPKRHFLSPSHVILRIFLNAFRVVACSPIEKQKKNKN